MQNSVEYYLLMISENAQQRDEIINFKSFTAQQIRALTDKPRLNSAEVSFLNQCKKDYKKLIKFKKKADEVRQLLYN